jgi:hypothetical protein
MKKSIIYIMVPNSNSDHQGTIDFLQEKIVKYFGSRNATADPMYPLVYITCDVNEEDITFIKDKTQNIKFTVLIGNEESERVKGDFIFLE